MTLPVMMSPTPPPAKLPSKRADRPSGNRPGPARLSAIAALAMGFGITVPLGNTSGENNLAAVPVGSSLSNAFLIQVGLFQLEFLADGAVKQARGKKAAESAQHDTFANRVAKPG